MDIFFQILIIFLSFTGVVICLFIRKKKAKKTPFVCPVGFNCEAVIRSKHTKFCGVDLEYIGIFYYATVFTSYIVNFLFPDIFTDLVLFILMSLTILAFVFSIYLTFLQVFIIKQWCSWCLLSALITFLIFFISIYYSDFSFILFLSEYASIILVAHMFALAIGVGLVSVLNILFLKFIKDFKISKLEVDILHSLTQFMWFMIFILIITGGFTYFLNNNIFYGSGIFMASGLVLLFLVIQSALFNLIVYPKLIELSETEEKSDVRKIKAIKQSFFLIALSFVSWCFLFFVFIANITFIGSDWGVYEIATWYLLAALVVVILSKILEKVLSK